METVDHHGRTTHYRFVEADVETDREADVEADTEIDVPATLYVHGSGGSHQVWANQYAPTGPAHPAVALDLTGHGESSDDDVKNAENDDRDAEETLDAYARDVTAVAAATDAAVLVGNSMGGAIALRIALDRAIDLDGLVLAGTGPALPVDETLLDLLASDFDAAVDLLHGEDVLFHDADERTLERSRATMRSAGQTVVQRDFEACDRFDVRDRLEDIDVPALAVVGERDRLTPPNYHRELADVMSDCRYEEIPDAAHLTMLDRPDAFNDAVERFIATVR